MDTHSLVLSLLFSCLSLSSFIVPSHFLILFSFLFLVTHFYYYFFFILLNLLCFLRLFFSPAFQFFVLWHFLSSLLVLVIIILLPTFFLTSLCSPPCFLNSLFIALHQILCLFPLCYSCFFLFQPLIIPPPSPLLWWEVHHGIVAILLDCDILVNEFELQLWYCIHFWTNTLGKGMSSLIPLPSYELNNTSTILLQKWLWNWITHKDWYTKENKPNSLL